MTTSPMMPNGHHAAPANVAKEMNIRIIAAIPPPPNPGMCNDHESDAECPWYTLERPWVLTLLHLHGLQDCISVESLTSEKDCGIENEQIGGAMNRWFHETSFQGHYHVLGYIKKEQVYTISCVAGSHTVAELEESELLRNFPTNGLAKQSATSHSVHVQGNGADQSLDEASLNLHHDKVDRHDPEDLYWTMHTGSWIGETKYF